MNHRRYRLKIGLPEGTSMEHTVLLIQKFGKFETWEKIGDGVYGSTYRSRDPLLDRQVVIKAFHAELTSSADFMDQFRREARQIASLRHANIINMIDGGDQDGQYYLVVEYLPGGSLQTIVRDGKAQPLSRAIEILKPVADALDYAHGRRVLHRDVKPSNILFAEDGHAVLTDFAVVKPAGRPGNGASMGILGTPEYLAPEQVMGGEAVPETDLYALGVVIYQLLAGQPPFTGTAQQVLRAQIEQPPADLRSFNSALPKEVADTVARALSKDPTKRFALAREFLDTLEQIAIRLSREQGRSLYQAAKEHMKLLQFDAAITKLEQVQALRNSAEVETLLKECQRRKQILDEVQSLRGQLTQIQARLDMLSNSETWLKSAFPESEKGGLFKKVTGNLSR
jgi:serine/threonine protein kinase